VVQHPGPCAPDPGQERQLVREVAVEPVTVEP